MSRSVCALFCLVAARGRRRVVDAAAASTCGRTTGEHCFYAPCCTVVEFYGITICSDVVEDVGGEESHSLHSRINQSGRRRRRRRRHRRWGWKCAGDGVFSFLITTHVRLCVCGDLFVCLFARRTCAHMLSRVRFDVWGLRTQRLELDD